jgi:hypothetical protein
MACNKSLGHPSACNAGTHTGAYVIVCDNCHVQELLLTATAHVPDIQISALDGRPRSMQQANCDVATPLHMPDTVPGSSAMRRVSVTNTQPIAMPFRWTQTEQDAAADTGGGAGVDLMQLGLSLDGQVSIAPDVGVLAPHETVTFDVAFAPKAVHDVRRRLRLLVDASWPQGARGARTPALEVIAQGSGVCQPACVVPTQLRAPGVIRVGETVTQTLMALNPSRAPARLTVAGCTALVAATPAQCVVPPESEVAIAVSVTVAVNAPFEHELVCSFEHGAQQRVSIHVPHTATPELPVDCSPLEFGLVRVHDEVTRSIALRSTSSTVAVEWSVAELDTSSTVRCGPEGMCCTFSAQAGMLARGAEEVLVITLCGARAGGYRSRITVTCGSHAYHALVSATVVAPQLLLGAGQEDVDLGVVYEGVPVQRALTLRNGARLPVRWRARPAAVTAPGEAVSATWGMQQGELAPGQAVQVPVELTVPHAGALDCLLAFDAIGASAPPLTRVRAQCRGLAVSYALCGADGAEGSAQRVESAVPPTIDFGRSIPIGQERELVLVVRNETGVQAPLRVWVEQFGVRGQAAPATRCLAGSKGNGHGLTLSEEHEKWAPFSVAAGNEIIMRRTMQVRAVLLHAPAPATTHCSGRTCCAAPSAAIIVSGSCIL